jgi:TIR domain
MPATVSEVPFRRRSGIGDGLIWGMGSERVDFFISHAGRGQDQEWAEWVAWHLEAAGYAIELDVWDWQTGQNFVIKMSDAMDRAERVVALFSAAYFQRSRYTTEEWSASMLHQPGAEGRLVPLRIENVPTAQVPAPLRPLLTKDLFGVGQEEALQVLLKAVSGPGRPEVEPPFPGQGPAGALSRLGASAPPLPASHPPASDPPPPPASGIWPFLRRHVAAVVVVAVALVAVVAGVLTAVLASPHHSESSKQPPPTRSPQPSRSVQPSRSAQPTPQHTSAVIPASCVSGSITLIGSGFGPIAGEAASMYMNYCKHATINVAYGHGITSAYGVSKVATAVRNHSAKAASMIAMYDGVTTLAAGLTPDPVGVLIYSVIAHTGAVPGSNISVTELKQLYTGPGGVPGNVGVGLQGGSANRQALLGLWGQKEPGPVIPGNCPVPSGHAVSDPSCTENSYAAALEFVDGTPGAIGYMAVDAEVDGHPTGYPYTSAIYTNTSVISIDGAYPTPGNVHDGSYAFVAVEHLYLPPHPTALAQSFLAYLPLYLKWYQSPDYTTCSNAPQNLAAECAGPR